MISLNLGHLLLLFLECNGSALLDLDSSINIIPLVVPTLFFVSALKRNYHYENILMRKIVIVIVIVE